MSKDYPCVYWNDGKCKKFSDDKVTSWCVWSPCASQTPSNADKIRAMSDEELAEFLCSFRSCNADEYICEGCKATKYCRAGHAGTIDWLQQPAKENDNGKVDWR